MNLRLIPPACAALVALATQGAVALAQEDEIADADRHFEQGDYDKAAAIYGRVIEEHGSAAGCGVYGKRVAVHSLKKQYGDGLAFARKAPERCRRSLEVREQEALLLWALGRRDEAAKVAEQVVQQQPTTFSNQKLLGEYLSERQPDRALLAYRAYLRHRPAELAKSDATPRIMLAFAGLSVAAREPDRRDPLLREARKQLELVEQRFAASQEAHLNAQAGLCAVYTAQSQWGPAVTMCERVRKTGRGRAPISNLYNLSLAHLNSRRPEQARSSALEYVAKGGDQIQGFELIGDSYYAQQRWGDALRYYDMAETKLGANHVEASLAAKVGRTYRRLGRNDRAAERLQAAWAVKAGDRAIAVELCEAQNALGKHEQALAIARPLLAREKAAQDPALFLVAADAELGLAKIQEARAMYLDVLSARGDDARARQGVTDTYNREAAAMLAAGKSGEAYTTLRRALKHDPKSIRLQRNLAVLAIEAGECPAALEHLEPLRDARSQQVSYHRLGARASLCAGKADAAARLYDKAATLARAARNNLALAEIYVESAPLSFTSDLDGAIERLGEAVQFSFGVPDVAAAAKRNRAQAYYLRGVRRLAEGDAGLARDDLEQATADPKALGGDHLEPARFALAMALIESGNARAAADLLGTLGGRAVGLKGPYASLGAPFFVAYARSRGDSADDVERAAKVLVAQSRSGPAAVRALAGELAGRAYLHLASLRYRARSTGAANAALDKATRYIKDDRAARVLRHNRIVISSQRSGEARARAALAALKEPPAEAFVNLGVAYDAAGDGQRAYDAWRQARARGYRSRLLDAWIEAKQRVFGYRGETP